MSRSQAERAQYDCVAAAIHWLTAAMVIPIVLLALFSDTIETVIGTTPIVLHKSLGITVFALTLLRVAWRLMNPAPPLPQSLSRCQRRAAVATHLALYTFMLLLPLSGYVFGSAGPYPMQWFGIDLSKASIRQCPGEAAHLFHEVAGLAIAALLAVHIGAALMHQFVHRDRLITRMSLPIAAKRIE